MYAFTLNFPFILYFMVAKLNVIYTEFVFFTQQTLKLQEEERKAANEKMLKQTAEESKQAEIARLQSLVPAEPPQDKNVCFVLIKVFTEI